MKIIATTALGIALALTVCTGSAIAAKTVKGEVVRVEQQVQTQNHGEAQQITVRTKQGEEVRLQVGGADGCNGCIRQGDQIRAKLMSGSGGSGSGKIASMKVRRQGEMLSYSLRDGQWAGGPRSGGSAGGMGKGDAIQDRDRDRLQDPTSANCAGCGSRPGGGSGGGRGGGSRGGGAH